MATYSLNINGTSHEVDVAPGTSLLWVLREHLGLTGTKYGCGIAQCGTCTIHVDGNPVRACILQVDTMAKGQQIKTIEGLSEKGDQSGQIMQAAALLETNPNPTREEIKSYMNGVLCRCGTYLRILKAIEMAKEQTSKTA